MALPGCPSAELLDVNLPDTPGMASLSTRRAGRFAKREPDASWQCRSSLPTPDRYQGGCDTVQRIVDLERSFLRDLACILDRVHSVV